MDKGKLEKLYDDASLTKLRKMWTLSQDLDSKASVLESRATSIQANVRETIKKKFGKGDDSTNEEGHKQVKELNKQWALTAASMVKVKRSIKLDGFHNSLNLYAHPRYGIKEHKRYSGWSPFGYSDPYRSNEERFKITGAILNLGGKNDDECLDFDYLENIPQLDNERVKMFAGITNDMVLMFSSWAEFYGSGNSKKREDLALISDITIEHNSLDDEQVKEVLSRMNTLLKLQSDFADELNAQREKWQPVIDKWHGLNKNFVVLHELAKTDLKI